MILLEILQTIKDLRDDNNNVIFKGSNDTKDFKDNDGKTITIPLSYYREFKCEDGSMDMVKIRVADHGSSLRNWTNVFSKSPKNNRQNIDIVFSENGNADNDLKCNTFFVVRQFVYKTSDITVQDLKKIIKSIISIPTNDFTDVTKKASYRVIRPTDFDGEYLEIPKSGVHKNQLETLSEFEKSKKNESFCNPKHVLRFDEFALLEKYEVYGHGVEFKTKTGNTIKSVVSLKDEYGGKTHITIDDGCYILYNGDDEKGFVISSWIYPEAHAALKELPNLPVY